MSEGVGAAETEVTVDGMQEALRNLRRRYVVYCLSHEDGPVAVDELAEVIAGWESENGEITAAHRKSVYSALHQTHLPKLESVGLVVYDRDAMRVRLTETAQCINFASDVYRSLLWPRRYLAVCGVGALLLLVRLFAVGPFAALGWAAYAVAVLVLVGGLAGAHLVATRRWLRRFERTRPDFVLDFERL
jgi:heme exporter protein D